MKQVIAIGALISALFIVGCQTAKEAANVADLAVAFEWAEKHRCATSPPAFKISGVPEGTATLSFKMTDLDVPTYNHGGGTVAYQGSGDVPEGAFTYKGPCPPSGAHQYRFTVTALNAAGDTILGRGSATQQFPPE